MKYFGMQSRMTTDLFLESFSIDKQFHRMAKKWHPDRANQNGLDRAAATSAFKLVGASMGFLEAYTKDRWSMSDKISNVFARNLSIAWCTFKSTEKDLHRDFPQILQRLRDQ